MFHSSLTAISTSFFILSTTDVFDSKCVLSPEKKPWKKIFKQEDDSIVLHSGNFDQLARPQEQLLHISAILYNMHRKIWISFEIC